MSFFRLDRGFELTYRSSDDSTLQIVKYGEYIYDHIVLFAPATKGNPEMTILQWVDSSSQNLVDDWMPKL